MKAKFGIFMGQGGYDYKTLERFWVEADQLGYHSAKLYDHFYSMSRPRTKDNLEAWTTVSALASQTEQLLIGHLVLCNSYRHPPLLAKMASTLDVISEGRLEFGIGAGWYQEEYEAYGFPYPSSSVRIGQLEEAVQIIKSMWTKESSSFDGEYYSVEDAICSPKPLQEPHPPILIGGGGKKLTLRVVAKHADIWNYGWNMEPEKYGSRADILAEHCESVDRDPDEIERSHNKGVFIAGDETKADRIIEQRAERRGISPEKYRERLGYAAIRTPEDCIDNLKSYEDAGVTYFFLRYLDFRDLDGLRLFAEEVMPVFS
jgi:F420-dependent oxidoreductase-like protein